MPNSGRPCHRLQLRLRPAERERDEGHDEHGGGGGGEQRLRDREIGAADDPVREEEHRAESRNDNGPADVAGPLRHYGVSTELRLRST